MQTVSIATLLHVYNLLINQCYLQTDRVIPILSPEGLILPAKKKNKFCIPYDGNINKKETKESISTTSVIS